MMKLIPRFKTGYKTPDWDPTNPYHYHTSSGEKVVVTPEDWEKYKDDPTFREVRAAVEAEQAAYPNPEYEINPNFIRDLRSTYAGNMGYRYQNYKNFQHNLPQGYSFTPEGVIIGPDGTAYVQSGYRQTPRFTYSTDNPLQFTINQGKPIERNLTFYPVNMDRKIKAPLPVDKIMDVGNEKAIAVNNYINNNRVVKNSIIPTYNIGYVTKEEVLEPDWHINGNSYNTKKQKMPYLYAMGNPNKPVVSVLEEDENIINDFFKELYNNRNYVRNEGKYPDITKEQALILLKKLNFDNIIDVEKFRLPSKWDITTSTKRNPSRQEAEKKAVISIGPLEKVKTFANGGPIGRRSNYTPPSLFATSNISSADNTRTNINQEIANIVAAREAKKQAAEQAYLNRRGYISEDRDKRSYAQRNVDAKIAATQNAKTDFYQMAAPNAQSTDVTPGQVLLPAVVAGTTFATPLTSLAYGAMYEPMEKTGVYQPVSLGLQKLGVNENTADIISPFITDPTVSLVGPIVRKFGSAYNKAWDSTYGNLNNLGIYNGFPIRTPNKKDASNIINKLLYSNSLQKESVQGTPLYLSHTTKDTGLESLIKDKNGILSAPSISITKGNPEYPMFSYIRNISRNNSIQPYMSPTDFSFFFKPSYIDNFKHVGVLADMYSPTIGDVKRYMGLPYNAKVSNSDVLKVKRQMLEDYGTWTDLNTYLRFGIEPKDVIPKLNMRGLQSKSLGDIAKYRDLFPTYAEVMPFGLVDLKKAMFAINNPYSNGIKANPVLREWIEDNNIPLFDYIEQVPTDIINKIKFKNGGNLFQQGGKVKGYKVSSGIMRLAQKFADKEAAKQNEEEGNGAPQSTFLMNRKNLQKVFEQEGYTKVNSDDYGPVTNAVKNSKHKDVPIYLKYPNVDVDRSNLVKIGTFMDYAIKGVHGEAEIYSGPYESYLTDPANFPVDIYIDRKTGKVYNQGWDFNDYNNLRSTTGISKLKNVAGNVLDRIGNPTVVTTGLLENENPPREIIDDYISKASNGFLLYNSDDGQIQLKPVTVTAQRTKKLIPKETKDLPTTEEFGNMSVDQLFDWLELNRKK